MKWKGTPESSAKGWLYRQRVKSRNRSKWMDYANVTFFTELKQRGLPSQASLNSPDPFQTDCCGFVSVNCRPSRSDAIWIHPACWDLEQLQHLKQ